MAEEPTAPQVELDAEAKQLLLEQTKAEARQAIAEAEEATAAAKAPEAPAWPEKIPEATLDAGDKGSVVAALEAFGVLSRVATDIADVIKTSVGKNPGSTARILIVDSLDLVAGYGVFRAIDTQLDLLQREVNRVTALLPAAPAAPRGEKRLHLLAPAVAAAVGALPLLAAAVKTDVVIRSRDVDVSDLATSAAVAGALVKEGFETSHASIRYPKEGNALIERVAVLAGAQQSLRERQLWMRLQTVEGPAAVDLSEATERLKGARAELEKATTAAARQKLQRRIERAAADVAAAAATVNHGRYHVGLAEETVAAVSRFLAELFVPVNGDLPPLVTAALHQELAEGDPTYLLHARTVQAGGETVMKKKWWSGLAKAHHIGGVAVAWVLADQAGRIIASGVTTRVGSVTTTDDVAVAPSGRDPIDLGVVQGR